MLGPRRGLGRSTKEPSQVSPVTVIKQTDRLVAQRRALLRDGWACAAYKHHPRQRRVALGYADGGICGAML